MSSQKSVMSGIGMMAALTISSKLVRLVILMITARFLTPEDFGIVAAFTMVFGFAYLISDMGIIRTIIQRPIMSNKHIGSAFTFSVSLCFIVFLSLLLLSDVIAQLLTIDEIALPLKISSAMFLLLGTSNVCSALFQRNGDAVFIGKVQALGTIIGNIFVTVPLLYFDIGYWAIIIGLWVAEFFSVVFIIFKGNYLLSYKAYKDELVEVIKYASAFFFNNTLGMVSQQIDIAIISKLLGSASLGNYSRAMQLVEFPNQVYWLVVDRVVFPVMTAMKSEKERLSEFFLRIISLLSLALTIGTSIIIVGAHDIVLIMMGDQWTVVAELLQILGACIIFRALASLMDSFLAAYNLVKVLTVKQVLSLIILLLSICFAVDYGITGIAYAVVIASALRFILTLILIVIYTEVSFSKLTNNFLPALLSPILILSLYTIFAIIFSFTGLISILLVTILFVVFCTLLPSSIFLTEDGSEFIKLKRVCFSDALKCIRKGS